MFNLKNVGILIAGSVLAMSWFWFSSSVQEEQSLAKTESVELRAEVAKNNLQKIFDFKALKNSKVRKPFLFSLKLDARTLAPKNFKVRKKEHLNLSALRIKTSFKESGRKQAFFLHGYGQGKKEPFFVRVKAVNEDLILDALPMDYVENALDYSFPNQSWHLLNNANKVIASSNESMMGQRFTTQSQRSVKKVFEFGPQRANLLVEVEPPYNHSMITWVGLIGIALMTLSLFFMSGRVFGSDTVKTYRKPNTSNEDLGISGLTFEEEMTKEIESLTDSVEQMEMTPVEKVKPVTGFAVLNKTEPSQNYHKIDQKKLVESSKQANKFSKMTNDASNVNDADNLDYNDFLMENPILGGADFLENNQSDQNNLRDQNNLSEPKHPKDPNEQNDQKKMGNSQRVENVNGQTFKETDAGVADRDSSSISFDESEVEEKQAEDWLKLAEDLTSNLDEFAKTFEKEKSPLNPHRKNEEDSQI